MTGIDAQSGETGRVCPRCHYQRTATEPFPDWQCPQCQIVYDKYVESPAPDSAGPRTQPVDPPRSSSPWPWLATIIICLAACGYLGYNYFQGPAMDKITLFTSNECGSACDQARDWLTRQQVAFVELNTDENISYYRQWKCSGGRGFPLVFFGKSRFEGFLEPAYEIALTTFLDQQDGDLNQMVIIYSKEGCPACSEAVDFFEKHRINFEEYDIKEAENYQVYRELFGRGTPLIFIGNNRFDGFNEKLAKMALEELDLL